MVPRFYAPLAEHPGDLIELAEEEADHASRVLRVTSGAPVRVFNGRGGEFDAVVERASRSHVHVRLTTPRVAAAAEPRVAVTLVQAALKGDRMDDVVRDAVMLGVAAIQPVVTARAETRRVTLERRDRRARWERIAISSAKQCGRAVVPEVRPVRPFPEAMASLGGARASGAHFMFVEPSAAAGALPLAAVAGAPPAETTIAIGPEGGWTAAEIECASAACRLLTLGARTIRADAMALVAVAALFAVWGEL